MTKDTSAIVKRIVDNILIDNYPVEFRWKEYIGGKRYTTVYIGERYKLIFSGCKGSLLEKYKKEYEVVELSYHNFVFLYNFCRLYKKLFNNYCISKRVDI